MFIRIGTSLLTVTVLAAFLTGVATNRLSGDSTTSPVKGGSIVDGISFEPDTLLPFQATSSSDTLVDQAIWAPLWYGDPQGTFHPGLATAIPSTVHRP